MLFRSRSKSSIWNEVQENSTNGVYNAKKAHAKAKKRRGDVKYQSKKIVTCKVLHDFVDEQLRKGKSPEAISGRLYYKREEGIPYISKESIYRYIH